MFLFRGKHSFIRISLGLLLICLIFFYNNCGNLSFESHQKSKTYKDPFKNNKFQVSAQSTSTTFMKTNSVDILTSGTQLNAVVSSACLQDQSQISPIARKALTQSTDTNYVEVVSKKLSQFTLSYTIDSEISINDLKILADEDACLIGLTNIQNLKIKSLEFNDPYFQNNQGLLSLHFQDSYEFFNHTAMGANSQIVVAVIDSGLDLNNSDLKSVLFTDSQGEHGHNLLSGSSNIQDDNEHGTLISSIIAAPANNGIGIVGVMPRAIKIYPLKVMNKKLESNTTLVAQAIDYASAQNVDVINLSLGGSSGDNVLLSSLRTATAHGIFISVAAGNEKSSITSSGPFPAAYCHEISGCLTVGSIISNTIHKSVFSNYSATFVDIMAPGEGGIYSSSLNNNYADVSGTSFAAPFVAGAAALTMSFLKTNNIPYDAALIENILKDSAHKKTALKNYSIDGATLDLNSLKTYLSSTYLSTVDGGFDED